ncbi:ABC transporter ATP-binding protein [Niallia sp. 01092]|uniref:ABC transporter ATP-binding protein n=1 Tax=Niallia sp. 01092 TaxID=3457759 RepID=UPI003FD2392C
MAELQLKNINKIYDKNVKAVNNFNLHIQDNEFIVFVGPSGCGKSTTLRMIAGLESISSGDLLIGDNRVNDVAPKDRDIAMVFQNYALYPHMTVYENIAFGLKLRKTDKGEIKKRVEHAADILGLTELLHRKPKALSGGQRQRVALGRAIVRDAKVFLMDEPLSNLDAKLRVQMRTEIKKLHDRLQTTTIYVTHDQTEAMTMATRIVIMKDGLIQQVGTPAEVYQHPANVFVGSFIGSPAMNFFRGKITKNGFHIGEQTLAIPFEKLLLLEKQNYIGKEIILGVRPEDIYQDHSLNQNLLETRIKATVEVTELTGSEILLYSSLAGQSFIARLDPKETVKSGDTINLFIDTEKIHFFDCETERKIESV